MTRRLKAPEKWALERLNASRPIKRQFPDGYNLELPSNDPPDCILRSKTDPKNCLHVEFSALGPKQLFEFYNVGLRTNPPFIARVRIPYEPEFWMEQLLKKKDFKTSKAYHLLCTHFCSHFALPGMQAPAQNTRLDQQPIRLTNDMTGRFARTIWEQGVGVSKAVVFVQPETPETCLTTPHEQPKFPEIDVSSGYPTVQILMLSAPLSEKFELANIPDRSLTIRPKNKAWITADAFRIPNPKIGEIKLLNTVTNQAIKDAGFAAYFVGPSMPKLKYVNGIE